MADEAERERRRTFVREHRTAVFGYPRKQDGPAMSVVYYVMEGDCTILVSTMRDRAKARAVTRSPSVSLCVLDEQWPLSYLQVYCAAELDPDFAQATELMMRISGVMAGHEMPDSARGDVEEMVRREHRVVLRLSPYATFQTPPRHVHEAADLKGLTHWTSTSLPW
ncbi:MAG: pyridoxamine 5'-phosphate oxidase family protein [Solirubrobacterales bacterium]|nr:pyridoxamine 5'-phosphate oxidase family protein [Solirubrobacterales bacterium]